MKNEIVNRLNHIEEQDGIPPTEVIAFNFGLMESDQGFVMYLVGGFEYSEEDDDWACIDMPEKTYRYLRLPDSIQSASWEQVLEQSYATLKELESEGIFKHNMLRNAQALTTGFDDGELIKIR